MIMIAMAQGGKDESLGGTELGGGRRLAAHGWQVFESLLKQQVFGQSE